MNEELIDGMREAGSRERIEKGKIKLNARVTRLFSASPFAPYIYISEISVQMEIWIYILYIVIAFMVGRRGLLRDDKDRCILGKYGVLYDMR